MCCCRRAKSVASHQTPYRPAADHDVRANELSMKLTVTVAFAFLPVYVHAAPPLDLEGHNDVGERITVVGESEPMHSRIWVLMKGKKSDLKGQRCGYSADDTTFSCSPDGTSPLAGATFRFEANAREILDRMGASSRTVDCGRIAVCKRGCGPRTPQELLESGYECYDEAVCPNLELKKSGSVVLRATNGTVKGNNVTLRDNPHSQSRVLRTVARGVRVKITSHTGACGLVNGKPGVWVFVRVLDDPIPKQGWMFDASISYQTR